MKKTLRIASLILAFAVVLQSCESRRVVVNREVETTDYGKMLLGAQTGDQFQKEPYSEWFVKEYEEYQPDAETMKLLKKEKLTTYNMTVFLGTWCGDSHREFPRLMKILNELKYPKQRLTIIAVNRKKESPNGEEGRYNIQKVPTIILSKFGKQQGRIIETPDSGFLEKDLLRIIRYGSTKTSASK